MSTFCNQQEFAKDHRYVDWPEGASRISYTDITHVKDGEWYDLVSVDIGQQATPDDRRERSFRLTLGLDKKFSTLSEDSRDVKDKKERYSSVITDTVALSATRLGLLSPLISGKTAAQLLELRSTKGIVLVPDTNSLYNGTLHWLMHVLKHTTVWLMPFVMSLTQMQARDANLKSLARNGKESNLPQALRSRALVNAGLSFLERNQHRYQVLELDPSLLRYVRPAGKGGFDQDEGEVLEDRLLIEGVHSVLRSTRTRTKQLVVTSDVLLSRVLGAEGIPNICLPTPRLPAEGISSFRYDAWAGTFMGTSIRGLLWDLAHAFGTVRIKSETRTALTLACYWPGKQPQGWLAENLDIREIPRNDTPPIPVAARSSQSETALNTTSVAEPKRGKREAKNPAQSLSASGIPPDPDGPTFSNATVPQSSLPFALRVGGILYASGDLTFAQLMKKLAEGTRSDEGNVRRSLEVLRRAQLVHFDNEKIRGGSELVEIESCLQKGQLDLISHQFKNFIPYKVILNHLQEHGELTRDSVRGLLTQALGSEVAREASIRLVRYHILLGQCWSDGAVWRDGSGRFNLAYFMKEFETAYIKAARDNVAQVAEFLPTFCRSTRMSPWAASRSVQEHARVLSEKFAFGYAVGGRPTGVDTVIAGSLLELEEEPVPMDRFEIGRRPVFTLERVR